MAATGTEAVTDESAVSSMGGLELATGARRRPGVGILAIIALFTASGSFKAASGNVMLFATGAGSSKRSFKISETLVVDAGALSMSVLVVTIPISSSWRAAARRALRSPETMLLGKSQFPFNIFPLRET